MTPSILTGHRQEMISGYRLDNLIGVHASLMALTETKKASSNALKIAIFWDHEEIGSKTAEGAFSPLLSQTLERITTAFGDSREGYFQLLANSFCISVDGAHGLHPNHPDRHDPQHKPLLGKGVVLKTNAQQRYASDAETAAFITDLCHSKRIPLQHFVSRSDMPCGSTVGPQNASVTGIRTVDLGIPQLSMHSTREVASCDDYLNLCRLLKSIGEK